MKSGSTKFVMSEDNLTRVEQLAAAGASKVDICRCLGFSEDSMTRYLAGHAGFADAYERGRQLLLNKAFEVVSKKIYGEKDSPPDPKYALAALKQHSEGWRGQPQQVQLTGQVGVEVLTDAQRNGIADYLKWRKENEDWLGPFQIDGTKSETD
jgi:hypothetical protein